MSDEFQELMEEVYKKIDNSSDRDLIIENLLKETDDAFIQNIIKSLSDEDFEICKREASQRVGEEQQKDKKFKEIIERKWGSALKYSRMFYIMTLENAEFYSKFVSKLGDKETSPKKWRYAAIRQIHGRGLQIYLEILELMLGGFADGAYARWRSMYELVVYAYFIRDCGEDVAKAFCYASESNDEYPDWANVSSQFTSSKGRKYKHVNFSMIEKKVNINEIWDKHYKLACRINHASPQATFKRLGNYPSTDIQNIITVGRTDCGFEIPGEHSVISLFQLSSIFFSLFPDGIVLARVLSLEKWVDIISNEYSMIRDRLFPNKT